MVRIGGLLFGILPAARDIAGALQRAGHEPQDALSCLSRSLCCSCLLVQGLPAFGILPAAREINGALQRAGPLSSEPGTQSRPDSGLRFQLTELGARFSESFLPRATLLAPCSALVLFRGRGDKSFRF